MKLRLKTLIEVLDTATCPEDIFGADTATLHVVFKQFAKVSHPDAVAAQDKTKAEETFKKLNSWYHKAEDKVTAGTYGDRTSDQVTLLTKSNSYALTKIIGNGDIADVWQAIAKDRLECAIKITRTPANNDLASNEAKTLRHIHDGSKPENKKLLRHIPTILDSFDLRDGKVKKRVNVLSYEHGSYTLAQLATAYPDGVPLQSAAWMFNRLLAALIAAHDANVVHGAIIPEHVLICPKNHNGLLIDWCYAVNRGGIAKAISPTRRNFYPPEVLNKKPLGCRTDIYMAMMCLLLVLGGDVATRRIPVSVPRPVADLMRSCWLGFAHRPNSAHKLFLDFGELLKALYGSRKFIPFAMPE